MHSATPTGTDHLLLRTLRGEQTNRPPVWVMRQAGRILPEYRAVRARLSGFKELCETPELAAEVTLQPVDLLGVDAAIIFSDILVVPQAMGLPYEMVEARGPVFPDRIQSESDIHRLHLVDVERDLGYVLDAITLVKRALNDRVPLIGFAGAPLTILFYMVEGRGSKTFSEARKMLYTRPDLAHNLLRQITEATIGYAQAQAQRGADVFQLFDSWAGLVSPELYREFALPYITQIVAQLPNIPVTVFAKGASFALADLRQCGATCLGLDWHTDPQLARTLVGDSVCLQGNLDPAALYQHGTDVEKSTRQMLSRFGNRLHIANLGHGVYPDTPAENVKRFIDTVKAYQYSNYEN